MRDAQKVERCVTCRRLHCRDMSDTQKVTLQLSTTPTTPMREWSQSSFHSYSFNSKTNMTHRTLEVWRYGCCAHSYCNWLLSKHDIKISGGVQTWLHAFINWCLAILTPENDAGRCLCLESSSIRRFPAPSSVPCRLAGSVSQCPSAARPSPSVTVPVQAADRQVECHDKYSNIPREGTNLNTAVKLTL